MTEADEDRADALFHALADRTRRDIMRRVLSGEYSVSALAASYDMCFAAVQKHVAVLEKAGLLTKRRSGREQLASGDVAAVRSVASLLIELEQVWRGRIARIDELIAIDPDPAQKRPDQNTETRRTDMPVTDVQRDLDTRTLTIVADFAAPVERVWQVYADPRQLEKVWGPPTYPATVVDHDLRPGGRVTYFMTGPEGDKHAGYWDVTAVDEPRSFSFDDGFADLDFNPNPALPVSKNVYTFAAHDGGTRATFVGTYATAEALQQVLDMGVVEGASSAINQIDDLLAS